MRLVDTIRRISARLVAHPHVLATVASVRAMVTRILNQADRRRRTVAITGAVLLHVLLLLFLLPQTSKGLSTGGSGGLADGGEGDGLTLDLTMLKVGPQLATAVAEQAQEDFTPITSENAAAIKTADNALALPDIATPANSPPEPSVPEAVPAQAKAQSAASAGGAGQGGQTAGTGDDLWAAIAPCWKRIAAHDALPVRLTVSFADNGLLQRAPEIVRDPQSPIDVRTQLSEGEAIQALGECGAYAMAAGRENVTINFPKP